MNYKDIQDEVVNRYRINLDEHSCRWVVPKRVLSRQEVIDIMNGD